MPGNATSKKSLKAILVFIENYVEENAIVLPGRIPGFKNEEIRLLSSSETKMSVWKVYEGTCKTSNEKAVSYRKFLQLWDEFYPDVVVAKPMTDLCLTCQQNTTKLQRAAHLSDEEKSECVKAHQTNLTNPLLTPSISIVCYWNLLLLGPTLSPNRWLHTSNGIRIHS